MRRWICFPLHTIVVCITSLLSCIALFISLRLAVASGNFINATITIIINQIMGLIVAVIAVNFPGSGLKTAFQLWRRLIFEPCDSLYHRAGNPPEPTMTESADVAVSAVRSLMVNPASTWRLPV